MIVADTCLVFHLFNKTNLTLFAQDILEKDPYWILPPLWQEEYANVLSKLARKGLIAFADVIKHFKKTLDDLNRCEVSVDIERALEISINHKISVYDAHFITLAIENNSLVITEDKEILKNCPLHSSDLKSFLKNK